MYIVMYKNETNVRQMSGPKVIVAEKALSGPSQPWCVTPSPVPAWNGPVGLGIQMQ